MLVYSTLGLTMPAHADETLLFSRESYGVGGGRVEPDRASVWRSNTASLAGAMKPFAARALFASLSNGIDSRLRAPVIADLSNRVLVREVAGKHASFPVLSQGLIDAYPSIGAGGSITVFGPQQYDRTTGPPNQYSSNFTLPKGGVSPFQLIVQNGDSSGNSRISSGWIFINGTQIISPSDFSQNVANITRTITLAAQNTVQVKLASEPGSYITLNITGANPPPTADAGPSQSVFTGTTVHLNGSGSQDPSGLPLTYSWNFLSHPAGSTATLFGANAPTPTFMPDAAGTYVAQLVVSNGYNSSTPSTATITAKNSTPIANAGPAQTVYVGSMVQLDGTQSSDPAGLPLSYNWSILSKPSGSASFLNDSSSATPTFSADRVGTYKFQLVVTNGYVSSAPATVVVISQNLPPVAAAGEPQIVYEDATVQLDGTGSYDPVGLALAYQWSFVSVPSNSSAALINATSPTPTFVADKSGTFVVQLIVNNGIFDSAPSTVTISTLNAPPVANAGPDQSARINSSVQLDGSHSNDVDGDALTYSWSFVSIPTGSNAVLANPTSVNPSFTLDVRGNYIVQLIVNDGFSDSPGSRVTISTLNSPPVAKGGPNQTITVTGTVQLDGSESTDVDGDVLTYLWAFVSVPQGSQARLTNPNSPKPTFVADVLGTYVLQLVVNDGTVNGSPATVVITSSDVPPVANPGPAQSVDVGSVVTLDGAGSTDSDDQLLSYQWSLLSKPASSSAALSQATSVTPNFIADVSGTYVVQLIVNDGFLNSSPVTVTISTINTPPVANPGPAQTVNAGTTVQLSAAASGDADGDTLIYKWAILTQPAGGTATLSSAVVPNPSFVANVAGIYVVQLTVNDGTYDSQPATVTITADAVNQAPVVSAGSNQTITLPDNSVTLNGSATDDGLPGGTLTFSWTEVSGPPGVTFSTPNQAVTIATFPDAGTYALQLTANDSQLSTSSTTSVIVKPAVNQPPVVSAGPNQTVPFPNTLTLRGSALSGNSPPGKVSVMWSQVSGPPVSFSDPTAPVTSAQFNSAGIYVLELTGAENGLSASSQLTISATIANQAPLVNAGPDQTIALSINTVLLGGSATDDDLPQGSALTFAWSAVVGPGPVTFGNPATPTTNASFSAQGTYTLRLTVSDSQLAGSADVHITVLPPDTPPKVSAGPNQTITLPANEVQMEGAASESTSAPGPLTVHWTLVSGPGSVSFANPNRAVTTAVFSQAGTYDLRLTASDTQLEATSDTTILVNPPPQPLATLTLSPPVAGPLAVSTSQTMTATLLDGQGHPLTGTTVQFQVTGANSNTGSAVTDGNGRAAFSWNGVKSGVDTVQAKATISGTTVSSNSALVSWVSPVLPITTAGIAAQFFAAPNGFDAAGFNVPLGTPPLWTQSFPLINFVPCYSLPGYTSTNCSILPFFDALVDSSGVYTGSMITAQGNGFAAGQGSLGQFEAVFTGEFLAVEPGQMMFLVNSDDGFQLGVGNGASGSATNPMVAAPAPRISSFNNYPLVAAFNGITDPIVRHLIIVNFPAAGNYPFEIDYAECCDGALTLSLVTGEGTLANSAKVSLTPSIATVKPLKVGQAVTFIAHVADGQGASLSSVSVELQVAGPNAPGTPYRAVSDVNGNASFTYTGNLAGTDAVTAVALSASNVASYSTSVQQIWEATPNNPPQVNAGTDQTIQWPENTVTLSGTVTDDGLPAGAPLTQQWSQVGGSTLRPTNGYTAGYALAIDHTRVVHSDQTDFPVEISGTYPFLANVAYGGSVENNNGWDIIFTSDVAGLNKLDHEIESYDPTTGAITAWVRVPTLSSSLDTVIFLWYGNIDISASQENRAGVWKNGYAGVWHLSGHNLALDSTGNNSGIASNVTPASGVLDGAGVFSGTTNSYVRVQNSSSFKPSTDLTLEAWVNPTRVTAWNKAIALDYRADGSWNSPFLAYALQMNNNTTGIAFQVTNSGNVNNVTSAGTIPLSSWSAIAGTFDSVNHIQHLYINGAQDSNSLVNNSASIDYGTSQDLTLGIRSPYSPGEEWIGALDELRISTVARSPDWIATEYNNESSPSTFYSVEGNVTFTTPNQAQTQANFSAPGTYVLQLNASDTQYTTGSEVTVTVQPPLQPLPLVSAGPNQTVTLPTPVLLLGAVSEPGLPSGSSLISQWSLVTGPAAVVFANPNQPSTSATFTQPGTYVLQLSGNDGLHTATDTATITVSSPPATTNQPPVITASSQSVVVAGTDQTLSGTMKDDGLPNGTLTGQWRELSGPAAVSFGSPVTVQQNVTSTTIAAANTQALFPVVGTYQIQFSASDSIYSSSVTVTVVVVASQQPIQAPEVNAGAPQTLTLPTVTATLDGQVGDTSVPVNQLAIAWALLNGPSPVIFANPYSPSTQATFGLPGIYQLQLSASDGRYTSSSTTTITVLNTGQTSQSLPPSVNAGPTQAITLPNNVAVLNGSASGPAGYSLALAWSQVSGPASVVFSNQNQSITQATFSLPGTYVLQLSAEDALATSTATTTVTVLAQAGPPPLVSLGLQNGSDITSPTAVSGSVTMSAGTWSLAYSLSDTTTSNANWITFASGTNSINGTLGTLDPTLLLNGTYNIQLAATDTDGQTSTTVVSVQVLRNMKLGQFSVTFNDLSVPLPGLPLQITRSYDSRNKSIGDFGVGWTLGLKNVRLQKSRNLSKNWSEGVAWLGLFPQYCLSTADNRTVTITFSDGKVYKFQAVSSPECQLAGPITAPNLTFTQLPTGSNTAGATLAPADGGAALVDGAVPGEVNLIDSSGNPYDPTLFLLTTKDGFTYTIDQKLGATKIQDLNGNTLTLDANGVTSSTGKNVVFVRDSQNRITQIKDPSGNTLSYTYDDNGDLASFTDAAQNQTTFAYQNHYLTTITDPRGLQPIRSNYDDSGRLLSTTDANGKTITYSPNLSTNNEQITDRLGNITTYGYDGDGNITSETDPLGNTSTYTFDANDNKLTSTDPLGKTTSYTYDSLGDKLTETDPLGNKTTYTYNSRGQALTVTDALGHTTTNVYDSKGNLTSTTDANGKTTTTVYGTDGLPSSVTDANGQTTQFQYDGSGNLTQQTDALSNVTNYTYDANGNKLSQTVTRTVNGQPQTLTTSYKYDPDNHLTETDYPDGTKTQVQYNNIGKQSATIDQLNRQTTYAYDNDGRLITTTYPDNTTETATYDAENHRLTSSDRAGHTTTYAYDADGRLTKTTYADQSFTQTNYDADGRVSSTVDANGNTTTYGYDDAGRRTSITDALNHVTTFIYDAAGNQTAVKDANQHTTQYLYDSLNRQTQVIYPDQTSASTTYDALGRIVQKTDQAGKVTGYGYDALGRLTSVTQDDVTGGLNLVTTYGYDEVGNRIAQTDANGHTTTYSYDQFGRRLGRTLPMAQSETYTYDAAGNLKAHTDFNGKTTTYAYDSSNRLLSKTPDVSFNAAPVSFTYTNNGLRTTMTDPSGVTTYTYDTRNHLTQKQTPEGTLNYTYDAAGDLLTLKSANAGGASDTYTYDMLNRLSTVTDASGATTYSYDAVGNLSGFTYPNTVTTSYSYDSLNRLAQMGAAKGGALSSYTYTLGPAGNRTSVAELSGRIVTYGYDSLYRLTSETVSGDPASKNGEINYTYDAVGNRNTLNATLPPAGMMNYTYDGNDRLGADQYDADGNTTSSGGTTNTYDFENRMLTHGGVNIVYDGDGNRVSETVGGVTTRYLVDTQNPTGYAQVVDELQNGAVTRTYSYGLERISETQPLNGTSTISFYGYDGHGSVRQLFDSTGAITDTYDYDAFGNLINSTGSTPNNYLFAGEQFDPALNLYYNRARYLNTNTGRFWSMDTYEGDLRIPISLHKYVYVSANPANDLDPSGQQDEIEELGAESIADTLNSIDTQIGLGVQNTVENSLGFVIKTEYGPAEQEFSDEALNAKVAVENGAPIYKAGKLGQSAGSEAQFWALDHPLTTPDFAEKYGVPPKNMPFDFVETGHLRPGAKFITRVAPAVETNEGGAIEVVVEPGGVEFDGLATLDQVVEEVEPFLPLLE